MYVCIVYIDHFTTSVKHSRIKELVITIKALSNPESIEVQVTPNIPKSCTLLELNKLMYIITQDSLPSWLNAVRCANEKGTMESLL